MLKKITSIPADCALIDILADSSFAREHIVGAKNISVYELAFLDKMNTEYPDKNQPLCIYGWDDKTEEVERAYNFLTGAGYTNISALEGGLKKWKADRYPTEKGEEIGVLDGAYSIDPTASRVEWMGRNIGNKHTGRISVASGEFNFAEGDLRNGELILDMNSLIDVDLLDESYNKQLVGHLKSTDFFAVDEFPETKLVLTGMDKLEAIGSMPNYHLKALLTIKGIANEIDFDAFVHERDGKMVLNAHFDIDRTRWNVKYGSERFFSKVGIHIVADIISFDLILVGNKA